jgi:pyruvate formate-lyase activating enzyme-like uncharacterized protein
MLSGGATCAIAYPVNPTKTSKEKIMKNLVLLNDTRITFVNVNLFELLFPKNNFETIKVHLKYFEKDGADRQSTEGTKDGLKGNKSIR